MAADQDEILAKLLEIEEQAARLLDESVMFSAGLARTRVVHIQNLAKDLRSMLASAGDPIAVGASGRQSA